jgi:hypothetical protein
MANILSTAYAVKGMRLGRVDVPSPLLEFVYLACWPSALIGIPQDYFQTNAIRNILINILGWTFVGVLPSLVPARRARK